MDNNQLDLAWLHEWFRSNGDDAPSIADEEEFVERVAKLLQENPKPTAEDEQAARLEAASCLGMF